MNLNSSFKMPTNLIILIIVVILIIGLVLFFVFKCRRSKFNSLIPFVKGDWVKFINLPLPEGLFLHKTKLYTLNNGLIEVKNGITIEMEILDETQYTELLFINPHTGMTDIIIPYPEYVSINNAASFKSRKYLIVVRSFASKLNLNIKSFTLSSTGDNVQTYKAPITESDEGYFDSAAEEYKKIVEEEGEESQDYFISNKVNTYSEWVKGDSLNITLETNQKCYIIIPNRWATLEIPDYTYINGKLLVHPHTDEYFYIKCFDGSQIKNINVIQYIGGNNGAEVLPIYAYIF